MSSLHITCWTRSYDSTVLVSESSWLAHQVMPTILASETLLTHPTTKYQQHKRGRGPSITIWWRALGNQPYLFTGNLPPLNWDITFMSVLLYHRDAYCVITTKYTSQPPLCWCRSLFIRWFFSTFYSVCINNKHFNCNSMNRRGIKTSHGKKEIAKIHKDNLVIVHVILLKYIISACNFASKPHLRGKTYSLSNYEWTLVKCDNILIWVSL